MSDVQNAVRRIVVNAADDIRVEQVPAPVAGANEVLVRSTIVGICGSDVHAAHGRHPFMSLPFWPGHEVIGVVEAAGDGAPADLVGRRVVVEPNLACGECTPCRRGRYNICATLDVFGCQTPGGMTDRFTIAADRVIPLPDDLSDREAALIEPLATPVHAVRRAGDLTGARVVVLGAGPIGLFVTIAALHAGAEAVVVADLLESKRARAERLGATGSFDSSAPDAAEAALRELGGKADVVFDCVSRESTVRLAIELLEKGGTVMTVGVPAGPTTVDLELIQDREISLLGNLMYVRTDVEVAIGLLRERRLPLDELITGVFSLDEAQQAFDASNDPEQVKVLVEIAG
ncbi:zinc-dependent alcohol dehydrogenase [Leucobacter chromiiresistens]|uniref:2-desacetyl-2-hydroxyethyl bacteriochlorophyllide A dehydrogenase n=1 Tax=Leucobacter chromiiresistens TaxID=1079994 RepID=A0A1H0XRK0_9MICO|nr:alcohol dehydrogenase catalytic domain-containing protein [Leucobacter chromiiresistens]SDQ05520.1 2-desacetyl-2-hydroxyethyl bacteriochlorophyllide A dehydrogenase [Leucobacter chromiiresistens]